MAIIPEAPQFKTPQEEVKWLERQLEQKKKEALEAGLEREHKELAREVLEKHVQTATPPTDYQISEEEAEELRSAIEKESHAKQVEELLRIADEKGILNAISVARKLDNEHLLDDFHDRIVYERLKIS